MSTANAIGDALAKSFAGAFGAGGGFGGAVPSGSLQKIAMSMLQAWGWGSQWGAFNSLVNAESGYRINATNPQSGAYGIPQALPPGKMATAGADWRTSGITQLRWMMGYIRDTYGSFLTGRGRTRCPLTGYDDAAIVPATRPPARA